MSHDKLTSELIEGWERETGCDRETAEIRAEQEMGAMHEAETCPACFPPCGECGGQWYACKCDGTERNAPQAWSDCGWSTGKAFDEGCEMGYRDFPDDEPLPGCAACRAARRWRDAQQAQARAEIRAGDSDFVPF